jgi:hypothetical protein
MSPIANRSEALVTEIVERRIICAGAMTQSDSVVTRLNFPAPPDVVWEGLMLYEQIGTRPPLFLRLLLPAPIRTEGRKSEVGDEVKCHYQSGHLLKRVTQVTRGRNYEFDVVAQNLALPFGIKLSGGSYTLRQLADGNTDVALMTRYVSLQRPRWLCRRIEAVVCHSFHRHILGAMRSNLRSR